MASLVKLTLIEQPENYQIVKQKMKTKNGSTMFELQINNWHLSETPIARATVVNPDGSCLHAPESKPGMKFFWPDTQAPKLKKNQYTQTTLTHIEARAVTTQNPPNYTAIFDSLVLAISSNRSEYCLKFEVYTQGQTPTTPNSDNSNSSTDTEPHLIKEIFSSPFVVGAKKKHGSNNSTYQRVNSPQSEYHSKSNSSNSVDDEDPLDSGEEDNMALDTTNHVMPVNDAMNYRYMVWATLTQSQKHIEILKEKLYASEQETSEVLHRNYELMQEHEQLLRDHTSLSQVNEQLVAHNEQLQQSNQQLLQANEALKLERDNLMLQLFSSTSSQAKLAGSMEDILGKVEDHYHALMSEITTCLNSAEPVAEVQKNKKRKADHSKSIGISTTILHPSSVQLTTYVIGENGKARQLELNEMVRGEQQLVILVQNKNSFKLLVSVFELRPKGVAMKNEDVRSEYLAPGGRLQLRIKVDASLKIMPSDANKDAFVGYVIQAAGPEQELSFIKVLPLDTKDD